MSAPLPVALPQPPTAVGPAGSSSPARLRWRRWRLPLALAAAVLATALVGLLVLRPTSTGYLDPANVAPDGTRAVVNVLREHGVDVRVRNRFEDVAADLRQDTRATVVVARTDLLLGERVQNLRRVVDQAGADLVLVEAGPALLADLELPLAVVPPDPSAPQSETEPQFREPQCADIVAARAGSALAGGIAYVPSLAADRAITSCYRQSGGAGYVALTGPGGGRTTVLGSGAALTNERLADGGNAALAIGTLGRAPRVVWWTPNPADTGAIAPPSLVDLLPGWLPWAVAQLVVALLVTFGWRARRLGRLVYEPLPVVVRSVETTLGRARLYRRARARGRAAQVLRTAALRRIAVRCNMSRMADPHEVAAVVAARVRRPGPDITALLVGADPTDDAALVNLARALDDLETEVRHP